MLISIGSYDMNIADSVINLIAKNPYKFPRPPEMNPVTIITPAGPSQKEVKEPAILFTYSMNFLYEKCMKFLLERLAVDLERNPNQVAEGIKRTVFQYPWQFVTIAYHREDGGPVDLAKLKSEIIPNPMLWSKHFYLEISEATIKYKDKKSKRD